MELFIGTSCRKSLDRMESRSDFILLVEQNHLEKRFFHDVLSHLSRLWSSCRLRTERVSIEIKL